MIALSVRQPHIEAILRGIKTIEYRSKPTNIRGTFYLYASLSRYTVEEESAYMYDYHIRDIRCVELPRGLIVGTAELVECKGGEWHLRNPVRLDCPLKPVKKPQPIWFYPF